ncbi:putative pyridoxal phosphate-dependent enzyme [mine drainage metagenome]|jgi:pyridoxal phosphate enzyme (YggS family)|uniref:Putative pyridoxal phosphate-dependent enzyme n=1 Tax=mine drainage metagenome TaxID=410659 RepID=T1B6A5_9ZZZZ
MLRASQNLPLRLRAVRERIAAAAARANRSVSEITLLAVSKAQPVDMLRALVSLEVHDFGESYLNEAVGKLDALAALPLSWHFVGRLQANKTRIIAERFQWVHGLDRLHIAERLSAQRPFHAPPLQVCIQVNLAEEASKGGVPPSELGELARAVATLPRLRLRGLMCLPPAESDPARQRAWFARLRALRDTLNEQGGRLDTLSMGMSADFESAILEGATLVRIGSALFGPRPARA